MTEGELDVAREKFQTLTEQMFYILLCLQSECYGMDIMEKVRTMTGKRISVGPGTLYNLLENFMKAEMICETKIEGRRRSYLITGAGMQALEAEYRRLMTLTADYLKYVTSKGGSADEKGKAQT